MYLGTLHFAMEIMESLQGENSDAVGVTVGLADGICLPPK
jgi:hypothetical protein